MSTALLPSRIDETSVVEQVVIPKSNFVFSSYINQIEVLISSKTVDDLFSNNADFIEYSINAMNRFS